MRKNIFQYSGILFITIIMICILSVRCGRNVLFEKNYRIEKHTWNYNDTLTFVTNIADTADFHDILVHIRNGGLYDYSNIFLFIEVIAPSGQHIKDTMEIKLADSRGKWYGSGLGDIKSMMVPYKTNIRFRVPGIYTFKLIQGMRKEELQHVFDIGLRIQNSKSHS